MYILGIHASGPISSVALIKDGKTIAAAPEERFVRRKSTSEFPVKAMNFCLEYENIVLEDIEYIAVAWNPGINASLRYRKAFSEWTRTPMERLSSIPNRLLTLRKKREVTNTEESFSFIGTEKMAIHHVTHHYAHAANAYYLSPFNEAAILTSDYFGEIATASWGFGRDNTITIFQEMHFPHSIGALYTALTEFLGFTPESDEWKVMGASPYGDPERFMAHFRQLYELRENGQVELDLNYFNHFHYDTEGLLSSKAYKLFGKPRQPDEPLRTIHFDISAALQKTTEEILVHALQYLHKETGMESLCLSGGTFMNCVFNGKALSKTPFKRLYVPFAPDDSGNSIGAALHVYHMILKHKRTVYEKPALPYLGPKWSNKNIKEILQKYNLRYTHVDDIEYEIAKVVAEGKVVGWFQDRMEFGQRALGNRSILADPRDEKIKDTVNSAIKYRENFRPFAPAILEEYVDSYFSLNHNSGQAPFMELALSFKKEKVKEVPAVVHVDGTGRLQTVRKEDNPRFYCVIDEFRKITNVPLLLNTSFNTSGEPIVCSPEDAIRTFYTSGLDCLVLGNYSIKK